MCVWLWCMYVCGCMRGKVISIAPPCTEYTCDPHRLLVAVHLLLLGEVLQTLLYLQVARARGDGQTAM